MGIFGTLMGKIFGNVAAAPEAVVPPAINATVAMTQLTQAVSIQAVPIQVDVTAILNKLASESKQNLDWKKSIVDLMKLVDIDSSLGNRKELAQELGYSGDMNDSAQMNIWLHKQVLQKLAENGGVVPQDLL